MSNEIKFGLIGFITDNLYSYYKNDLCCDENNVWMPSYIGRHWPSYLEMLRREQLDYVESRVLREVEEAIQNGVTHLVLVSPALDWMLEQIKVKAPNLPVITVADAILYWIRQNYSGSQRFALVEMNEFLISKVFRDTLAKSRFQFFYPPDLEEKEMLIVRTKQSGRQAIDDLVNIESCHGPMDGVILGCSFVNTKYNDTRDHMNDLREHMKAIYDKSANQHPCRRAELILLRYLGKYETDAVKL